MNKLSTKRKQIRRKYKRYAAAVASAAILTGAVLPGIPAATALAAERPASPYPWQTEQLTQLDKDAQTPAVKQLVATAKGSTDKSNTYKTWEHRDKDKDNGPPGRGWHQHRHSWPGSNENEGWYQDGRIYYRSSDYDYYPGRYVYTLTSPVDIVKDASAVYGFNRTKDTFTVLTMSSRTALVEVRKSDTGKLFNVYLTRNSGSDWYITQVRSL